MCAAADLPPASHDALTVGVRALPAPNHPLTKCSSQAGSFPARLSAPQGLHLQPHGTRGAQAGSGRMYLSAAACSAPVLARSTCHCCWGDGRQLLGALGSQGDCLVVQLMVCCAAHPLLQGVRPLP
jgi:hypothetical protein